MTDEPVTDPVWPEEGAPTPEQIAGRPLVDLALDELKDLAAEVDLAGRSKITKRGDLIVALGGDPDAMTDAERVEAAAALADAEANSAPTEDLLSADPAERIPAIRHEDNARDLLIEDEQSQNDDEATS